MWLFHMKTQSGEKSANMRADELLWIADLQKFVTC